MDKRKLILCYTYFNGIDQFKHSFSKMSRIVDDVIICYQTISNTGNENKNVLKEIEDFHAHKIHYKTDLDLNTKENERRKHNLMIQEAKKLGATHFILSAVDHVYSYEDVCKALNENVDVTFTRMYTYYKHENWRIDPPESYYMPFIHKMYNDTCIVNRNDYPVLTDPSVRVNTINSYKVYDINECVLHHFSMVRNDIHNKFINSASRCNWSDEKLQTFIDEYENAKVGDSISYFKGGIIVER
jgi:hypothetical protein